MPSPHYAHSNGQVEMTVLTVKSLLKKDYGQWISIPYVLLLQCKNAQLSDFNKSPVELLFNRPLKKNCK